MAIILTFAVLIGIAPLAAINVTAENATITIQASSNSSNIFERIISFFQRIIDFFKNLFLPSGKEPTLNSFTLYELGRDSFYNFIENPSQIFLEESRRIVALSKLSNSSLIKHEFLNENPIVTGEADTFRLSSSWLVYGSLVDFAGNTAALEKYLSQNGVAGTIDNVALLHLANVPVTIWLSVNQASYFITVEHKSGYFARGYNYSLYNHSDYVKKFGVKDGTLIVNGNDITDGNYVKIDIAYRLALLPLMATFEELGADVKWIDNATISITYNAKEYVLDTGAVSFIDVEENKNIPLFLDGGTGYAFFQIIDNDLILDSPTMNIILRELTDLKLTINYDELTVNIG